MGAGRPVNGMAQGLRIGEVASRSGVSRHTLRYYEREGLIPPPPRTSSGYRSYPEETVERLEFIRKAQTLGLRLSDIREVLEVSSGGIEPCEHVRRLIEARLRDAEERLAELTQLRATLRRTLDALDEAPATTESCRCPVIETNDDPLTRRDRLG